MDGWMDGWMDEWLDGLIDRWMDGWMNGYMDVYIVVNEEKMRIRDLNFTKISTKDPHTFFPLKTKPRLNRSTNKSSLSLKREFHWFTKQTLFTRI